MRGFEKKLEGMIHVNFPIIMAPMFLVSNKEMMIAGMKAGVMANFPTLNYRKEGELGQLLDELNKVMSENPSGSFGVNLIVQKTNIYFEKHLKICIEKKVPFYITSLGNPEKVIKAAHAYGAKVFCDVTNLEHAQKCYDKGCDGFIAVGQGAGGHAGPNPLQVLVPALRKKFPDICIVAAGSIADGLGLLSAQVLGADGVSIGTRFIASTEATVSEDYKEGIVKAGMDDIVMTTKLSGTPASIINTPSAQKLGLEQNWFEKMMSNNPRMKKWFKTLVQVRGMKKLEQSVLPNNYMQLWGAGKSSEFVHDILPCETIIHNIMEEYNLFKESLKRSL